MASLGSSPSALLISGRNLAQGTRRASYLFTFVTEFAVFGSLFLSLKLAATLLGPVGFGEYAVARRAFAILAPALLLGLHISLARWIALTGSAPSTLPSVRVYLLVALLISTPILLMFAGLATTFADPFAQVLFGSPDQAPLVAPLTLTVVGLSLHHLVYQYYRGQLKMWTANGLQLVNMMLVPPLAVLLAGSSAAGAIALTGTGWMISATALGGWALKGLDLHLVTPITIGHSLSELLTYGLLRLPATLALPGLFAVPTFLVAHIAGIADAGLFSFGISLLQLFAALFAPVSILLLPLIGRLAAEGRWERIERVLLRTLGLSLALTLLLTTLLELILEPFVELMLGAPFVAAVSPLRWLVLGAVPYVVHLVLRSPLDAITSWPYNSLNLTAALVTAMILIWFGADLVSPQLALFLALLLLGALSLLAWRSALRSAIRRSGPPAQVSGP